MRSVKNVTVQVVVSMRGMYVEQVARQMNNLELGYTSVERHHEAQQRLLHRSPRYRLPLNHLTADCECLASVIPNLLR